MKGKNCKITIEYTVNNDPLYPDICKVIKVYRFNDYRICNAVMILLGSVNSKWIRKEFNFIKRPKENFMNPPE